MVAFWYICFFFASFLQHTKIYVHNPHFCVIFLLVVMILCRQITQKNTNSFMSICRKRNAFICFLFTSSIYLDLQTMMNFTVYIFSRVFRLFCFYDICFFHFPFDIDDANRNGTTICRQAHIFILEQYF